MKKRITDFSELAKLYDTNERDEQKVEIKKENVTKLNNNVVISGIIMDIKQNIIVLDNNKTYKIKQCKNNPIKLEHISENSKVDLIKNKLNNSLMEVIKIERLPEHMINRGKLETKFEIDDSFDIYNNKSKSEESDMDLFLQELNKI